MMMFACCTQMCQIRDSLRGEPSKRVQELNHNLQNLSPAFHSAPDTVSNIHRNTHIQSHNDKHESRLRKIKTKTSRCFSSLRQ